MARHYAAATDATRLTVEVDFIAGRAPRTSVLEHLQDVLARDLDKPKGVRVIAGEAIAEERSSWTFEQIEDLEARHRAHRSQGRTATMWLVYLSGQLAGEPNTLGVAYRASAAAVFPDRMERATTAAVQGASIERAVVTHEAGHLLALVEIGYESRHDRTDPNSPGHSTNDDSVMVAAIEDLSLIGLLRGGPPDEFDAADRDDIAGWRTGRF